MASSNSCRARSEELTMSWRRPIDDPSEIVAMRRAIYGGELGWVEPGSGFAWDRYDLDSTTLLVRKDGRPIACGRLTIDSDGPLEVSDLVAWREALPLALRDAVA